MNIKSIQLLDLKITDLRPLDDEDVLLGVCTILGVQHHVQMIRVEYDEAAEVQRPTHDPYGRYTDLQWLYEGEYYTISLTELEIPGDWVVAIYPFAK